MMWTFVLLGCWDTMFNAPGARNYVRNSLLQWVLSMTMTWTQNLSIDRELRTIAIELPTS